MAECGQGPCSALTGLGQQLFWLLAMGEVLEATPGGDGEVHILILSLIPIYLPETAAVIL